MIHSQIIDLPYLIIQVRLCEADILIVFSVDSYKYSFSLFECLDEIVCKKHSNLLFCPLMAQKLCHDPWYIGWFIHNIICWLCSFFLFFPCGHFTWTFTMRIKYQPHFIKGIHLFFNFGVEHPAKRRYCCYIISVFNEVLPFHYFFGSSKEGVAVGLSIVSQNVRVKSFAGNLFFFCLRLFNICWWFSAFWLHGHSSRIGNPLIIDLLLFDIQSICQLMEAVLRHTVKFSCNVTFICAEQYLIFYKETFWVLNKLIVPNGFSFIQFSWRSRYDKEPPKQVSFCFQVNSSYTLLWLPAFWVGLCKGWQNVMLHLGP